MGAPLDQFLRLLWRPPYVCFFNTISGPKISFFAYYMRATQISFFSYNMGAPFRSVSLLTICPLPLDQFLNLIYGPPIRLVSTLTIWGPSDRFLCIEFGGSSQISVFFYYMEPPQTGF